jgi:cytochrome c-type biogenesis protein CcmF
VLLVVACASVLLGTLYPLLIDALGAGKLSVGPPYFDAVFVPLMLPAAFLMGVAPFARWKHASVGELARTLRWAFLAAALVGIAAPFLHGEWKPLVALSLLLASWIVLSALLNLVERVQSTRAGQSFLSRGKPAAAQLLRHASGAHRDLGLHRRRDHGQRLPGREGRQDGGRRHGQRRRLQLSASTACARAGTELPGAGRRHRPAQGRRVLRKMFPEKRFYVASSMPMTEAAIDSGFLRDVYVSLGEPIDKARPEAAWAVRVYHKPFVDWIWGGCVLMASVGCWP